MQSSRRIHLLMLTCCQLVLPALRFYFAFKKWYWYQDHCQCTAETDKNV